MFRPRCVLALIAVVAVLNGCTAPDDVVLTDDTTTTTSTTTEPRPMTTTTTTIDPADTMRDSLKFAHAVATFAEAVTGVQVAGERVPARDSASTPSDIGEGPSASATLEPCGADDGLPPCEVAQNESGGSYTAVNWGGCGGNNCYGKWQFSGAWAGKLGLPDDLLTATPEQQDNAARQLWAGGAGCGNWSAC